MRIAIVDDSGLWRERILECMKECIADTYAEFVLMGSGTKLLNSPTAFDIVLLDVEMEGLDGFETARSYLMQHPESYIIMLTMHGELSRKGYEVNAFRYIDKNEMEEGIREAWRCLQLRVQSGKSIRLKVVGQGNVDVSEDEIVSIETIRHGVMVHTIHSSLRVSTPISQLMGVLDEECFFRTHHSWIVNWKYVEQIEGADIRMKFGPNVMLSQSQASLAKRNWWMYRFQRARG